MTGRRVVAIDGPAGAGKSTVSRAVAQRLDLPVLDTGAMYRAITFAALQAGVDPTDSQAVAALCRAARLEVGDRVVVDGVDATAAIRGPEVTAVVSVVAANPEVRSDLLVRQRDWVGEHGGGVVEGRDIGTVVFPDAAVKVFLTADPEVRAERRQRDEHAADRPVELADVHDALHQRDLLDSSREVAPLEQAHDALLLDTTRLGIDEVVDRVVAAWESGSHGRGGAVVTDEAPPSAEPAPPPAGAAPVAVDADVPKRLRGNFDVGDSLRGWRRVCYQLARVLVSGVCRSILRAEVHGIEQLPRSGAFVLAPTHRSGWDIPMASLVTRRRVRFMGKASIWRVPVVGELLALLGGFPVERGTADQKALRTVMRCLEAGEPVVIYPEGTRQSGHVVGALFDGAAWVAARTPVPIVPLGIAGSEGILRGRSGFRLPKVVVVVGDPIPPVPHQGAVPRAEVRRVTAELGPILQALYDEAESVRNAPRR